MKTVELTQITAHASTDGSAVVLTIADDEGEVHLVLQAGAAEQLARDLLEAVRCAKNDA